MNNGWKRVRELFHRLKDLTTIGIANVIASAISAIFWFYIAALLGTEHYGEISYFIAIAGVASVISLVGAGNTLIIYTAKEMRLQATIYFIALISSVIASIVLFFVFFNTGISLYVIGYVIFGLATSEILGRKLYSDYSKYMITQRILMAVLGAGLYFVFGPNGVILGISLAFFPYLLRIYKGFKETRIEFSLIKPKLGFMMNSYLLDLSRAFSGYTDKLIIAPLFGFSILGNYHLAIQLLSVLTILPSIVYQYVLPRDASGFSNRVLKKFTILLSVGLAIIGMVFGPIVLPFFFPKFTEAGDIIRIVSITVIPTTVNFMYISKFMGQEMSKIILVGSGIYLLILVSSIVLLGEHFGVNGIASSLVIAASCESLYLFMVSRITHDKNQSR